MTSTTAPTSPEERTDAVAFGSNVRLTGVTKRYGATTAVDAIDFAVEPGEFVTLLGPSGSGKTTILKMLAGFEAPTSGSIEIGGREVSRLSPAERNIGMVFQHYALFPHMAVSDNIAYGLKKRRWPRADRARRVDEMLELVGLTGYGERRPQQLSGGQQQRVALARALATKPQLLLMDEPLGALDRALRIGMSEEIKRLHRETQTTFLYVTHDQEEALLLSDRVTIMRNGSIQVSDSPERIFRRPESRFVAEFFGNCNILPSVSAVGAGAGRIELGYAGASVAVDTHLAADDVDAVAFHADAARIVTTGATESTGQTTDGALRVDGTIAEVMFLGLVHQASVVLADGTRLRVHVPDEAAATLSPGDPVTLALPASALIALPR